ncbi:hypothetical protein KEJ32_00860 [Candidatus Bathyarchaeota archaeon]|nr:hypothetical protein [Candidatus Bathyarchaeota archaeon]
MDEIPEHQRLYFVKNLRGIIYLSRGVSSEKELEWLKRKFRYRELGISETLKLDLKWKKLLTLPKTVENPVLDSLLQASSFVCPLIILKEDSLKDFENAVVAALKTKGKLGDKDLKFNLRLVNYAITDFYTKSIELALQSDLDERKRLAEKDLKRFWRIPVDADGKVLVAYIDPLLVKGDLQRPIYMSLVPSLVLDLG